MKQSSSNSTGRRHTTPKNLSIDERFPDKIQVDLSLNDFVKDYDVDDLQFITIKDCPLARAIKRHFKSNKTIIEVIVGGIDVTIHTNEDKKIIYLFNLKDWGYSISKNVFQCYQQGDKTIYYVELTKRIILKSNVNTFQYKPGGKLYFI